jgi:hypothetical protein
LLLRSGAFTNQSGRDGELSSKPYVQFGSIIDQEIGFCLIRQQQAGVMVVAGLVAVHIKAVGLAA